VLSYSDVAYFAFRQPTILYIIRPFWLVYEFCLGQCGKLILYKLVFGFGLVGILISCNKWSCSNTYMAIGRTVHVRACSDSIYLDKCWGSLGPTCSSWSTSKVWTNSHMRLFCYNVTQAKSKCFCSNPTFN
jgi:hypothetical protein